EANEAALKLARRWALDVHGADKSQIIAFKQGFHGRTFFTVTVGGQTAYSDGFGPKPGDIDHAEYNNLDSLKALISNRTCAVMIEPLQGEGGVVAPTDEFIKGVSALCNQHNALLIFDEVQTGIGRLGDLYAYMDLGVTPDILTSAKGLGGGFPIGAMLTTTEIAKHLKIGTHGSTYGGNPLACAVSEAVLDTVNSPEVLAGIKSKAKIYVAGLNAINAKYNIFSEIRGKGLLIGAVLNENYQGKAKVFLNAAMDEGLMVLVAGASIIRFAPSLVIPDEDITLGLARFEKAIASLV
ncbi:MAG TPA: aspartate aminotransferase family protein, partial [Colwellia sp.]|nr:aspartate aminotransferase family protein [Colwellia sp.]